MSRKHTGVAALLVVALISAVAVGSGSAAPSAGKSVSFSPCNISGKQKSLGASYVTSLKVAGVSCAKGEKVIKAYHQCRHESGPGGSCGRTVLGFSCKDGKRQSVPDVQYSTTAKCRKTSNAGKRIKSAYTQNF
jgi:hypothetical protein